MVWTQKKVANIALVLGILDITMLIVVFFQTEYQLTSPLIPASTILEIVRPYLLKALFSCLAYIAALIFYLYARYIVTIIICAVTVFIPVTTFYFLYHPKLIS